MPMPLLPTDETSPDPPVPAPVAASGAGSSESVGGLTAEMHADGDKFFAAGHEMDTPCTAEMDVGTRASATWGHLDPAVIDASYITGMESPFDRPSFEVKKQQVSELNMKTLEYMTNDIKDVPVTLTFIVHASTDSARKRAAEIITRCLTNTTVYECWQPSFPEDVGIYNIYKMCGGAEEAPFEQEAPDFRSAVAHTAADTGDDGGSAASADDAESVSAAMAGDLRTDSNAALDPKERLSVCSSVPLTPVLTPSQAPSSTKAALALKVHEEAETKQSSVPVLSKVPKKPSKPPVHSPVHTPSHSPRHSPRPPHSPRFFSAKDSLDLRHAHGTFQRPRGPSDLNSELDLNSDHQFSWRLMQLPRTCFQHTTSHEQADELYVEIMKGLKAVPQDDLQLGGASRSMLVDCIKTVSDFWKGHNQSTIKYVTDSRAAPVVIVIDDGSHGGQETLNDLGRDVDYDDKVLMDAIARKDIRVMNERCLTDKDTSNHDLDLWQYAGYTCFVSITPEATVEMSRLRGCPAMHAIEKSTLALHRTRHKLGNKGTVPSQDSNEPYVGSKSNSRAGSVAGGAADDLYLACPTSVVDFINATPAVPGTSTAADHSAGGCGGGGIGDSSDGLDYIDAIVNAIQRVSTRRFGTLLYELMKHGSCKEIANENTKIWDLRRKCRDNLLKHRPSVCEFVSPRSGWTPLLAAVKNSDLESVRAILACQRRRHMDASHRGSYYSMPSKTPIVRAQSRLAPAKSNKFVPKKVINQRLCIMSALYGVEDKGQRREESRANSLITTHTGTPSSGASATPSTDDNTLPIIVVLKVSDQKPPTPPAAACHSSHTEADGFKSVCWGATWTRHGSPCDSNSFFIGDEPEESQEFAPAKADEDENDGESKKARVARVITFTLTDASQLTTQFALCKGASGAERAFQSSLWHHLIERLWVYNAKKCSTSKGQHNMFPWLRCIVVRAAGKEGTTYPLYLLRLLRIRLMTLSMLKGGDNPSGWVDTAFVDDTASANGSHATVNGVERPPNFIYGEFPEMTDVAFVQQGVIADSRHKLRSPVVIVNTKPCEAAESGGGAGACATATAPHGPSSLGTTTSPPNLKPTNFTTLTGASSPAMTMDEILTKCAGEKRWFWSHCAFTWTSYSCIATHAIEKSYSEGQSKVLVLCSDGAQREICFFTMTQGHRVDPGWNQHFLTFSPCYRVKRRDEAYDAHRVLLHPCHRQLLESIISGTCVVFLGSGFIHPAGGPAWADLLEELSTKIEVESSNAAIANDRRANERRDVAKEVKSMKLTNGKATNEEMERAAQMMEDVMEDEPGTSHTQLRKWVKEILDSDALQPKRFIGPDAVLSITKPPWPFPADYCAESMANRLHFLGKVPFRGVITTNYNRFVCGCNTADTACLCTGRTPFTSRSALLFRAGTSVMSPTRAATPAPAGAGHADDGPLANAAPVADPASARADHDAFLGSRSAPYEQFLQFKGGRPPPKSFLTPTAKPVIHAHGSVVKPEDIVLTKEGYRQLKIDGEYIRFMTSMMATSTLLFIGFSFTDEYLNEIRNLVVTMLGMQGSADRPIAYGIIADKAKVEVEVKRSHDGLGILTFQTKKHSFGTVDYLLNRMHRLVSWVHVFAKCCRLLVVAVDDADAKEVERLGSDGLMLPEGTCGANGVMTIVYPTLDNPQASINKKVKRFLDTTDPHRERLSVVLFRSSTLASDECFQMARSHRTVASAFVVVADDGFGIPVPSTVVTSPTDHVVADEEDDEYYADGCQSPNCQFDEDGSFGAVVVYKSKITASHFACEGNEGVTSFLQKKAQQSSPPWPIPSDDGVDATEGQRSPSPTRRIQIDVDRDADKWRQYACDVEVMRVLMDIAFETYEADLVTNWVLEQMRTEESDRELVVGFTPVTFNVGQTASNRDKKSKAIPMDVLKRQQDIIKARLGKKCNAPHALGKCHLPLSDHWYVETLAKHESRARKGPCGGRQAAVFNLCSTHIHAILRRFDVNFDLGRLDSESMASEVTTADAPASASSASPAAPRDEPTPTSAREFFEIKGDYDQNREGLGPRANDNDRDGFSSIDEYRHHVRRPANGTLVANSHVPTQTIMTSFMLDNEMDVDSGVSRHPQESTQQSQDSAAAEQSHNNLDGEPVLVGTPPDFPGYTKTPQLTK